MLKVSFQLLIRLMNKISLLATTCVCLVLLSYRLWYSDLNHKPLKATTSDAFGYYMYLPKLLIYKDLQLNWVKDIEGKYGGSYSTRALCQSYPVFALPLAALIAEIRRYKARFIFYLLSSYLIVVNLFQINQYNKTVLHFKDMNRQYYSQIYLNPNPNALDMSLLDTKDWLNTEGVYQSEIIVNNDSLLALNKANNFIILNKTINQPIKINNHYLKLETELLVKKGYWNSYILTEIISDGKVVKSTKIRLFNPIAKEGRQNKYAYYMKIPDNLQMFEVKISIRADNLDFNGVINH